MIEVRYRGWKIRIENLGSTGPGRLFSAIATKKGATVHSSYQETGDDIFGTEEKVKSIIKAQIRAAEKEVS